jgi:hypothetical protein
MSTKQHLIAGLWALALTYAGFVFASWQFNPATWPEDARFAFILCVAGLYVLNYISAVEK